jgi:hypothetical protein
LCTFAILWQSWLLFECLVGSWSSVVDPPPPLLPILHIPTAFSLLQRKVTIPLNLKNCCLLIKESDFSEIADLNIRQSVTSLFGCMIKIQRKNEYLQTDANFVNQFIQYKYNKRKTTCHKAIYVILPFTSLQTTISQIVK